MHKNLENLNGAVKKVTNYIPLNESFGDFFMFHPSNFYTFKQPHTANYKPLQKAAPELSSRTLVSW